MSALSEWKTFPAKRPASRKQGTPLLYFLIFMSVIFIGILIFCYAITKRTNPIYVDVNGKPVAASAEGSHH